jgi:tripartite-type tricarboxylate transporter receptor subunit TctC
LAERGDEIGGGTVEEFAARVRREHAEWGALVREAGIRAE